MNWERGFRRIKIVLLVLGFLLCAGYGANIGNQSSKVKRAKSNCDRALFKYGAADVECGLLKKKLAGPNPAWENPCRLKTYDEIRSLSNKLEQKYPV